MFRRKHVKPQSMATTKHKFHRLVFNPANQKLIDFLDELQKLAKDAFGVAAQAIIEQFIYAKMPPNLNKSINHAHLENGTYERIVSHLERALELNGLEAPDEMPINTVTQQAPQQNSEKPKPTCHHCKKPCHCQNQCRQLKRENDQTRNHTNSANNSNGSAQTNSNPNPTMKFQTSPKRTKQIVRETKVLDLSSHPVRPVVELSTPQRMVTWEQTQQTGRIPGIDDRKEKIKPNREMREAAQKVLSKLQPKLL